MSKLDQEDRDDISARQFAFPKQRKEPLEDASHVRNAIARFDQVKDVTDHERDEAWKRIRAAAKKFDVEMNESDWREVGNGKKDKH
jgi:cell division protein FtsX